MRAGRRIETAPSAATLGDRRRFLVLTGAALVSGCGSIQLLPTPMQPQLYVLRPQSAAPMGAPVALSTPGEATSA